MLGNLVCYLCLSRLAQVHALACSSGSLHPLPVPREAAGSWIWRLRAPFSSWGFPPCPRMVFFRGSRLLSACLAFVDCPQLFQLLFSGLEFTLVQKTIFGFFSVTQLMSWFLQTDTGVARSILCLLLNIKKLLARNTGRIATPINF